jgi:cytochrome c
MVMPKTLQSLVIISCVAMCAGVLRADPAPPGPHLPKGWKFSLPAGDAQAGREALRKMECYSCHRIPGGDFPEARSSGGIGPDLVAGYSKLPREFLAESIINSHKQIAGTLEHYRGLDKVSSKMGDYSSIMSVRELLDIVEFLKHLGAEPAGHP